MDISKAKIVKKAFPDTVFFGTVAASENNYASNKINPTYVTGDIFNVSIVYRDDSYLDVNFFSPNSNEVLKFREFCFTFKDMREFTYYWDIIDRRVLVEKIISRKELRY